MRILYLHQYFALPESVGGTRSYEFARRLAAGGHEVCMIASSAMLPASCQPSKKIERRRVAGIDLTVIHVPYSNRMTYRRRLVSFFSFALGASLEVWRQPADLVFASSTPLTVAIPGIIGKIVHRAPLVLEVRDLWPELPIRMGALRNPFMIGLARLLEWISYRSSDCIIALSPGMAHGIANRGVESSRIKLIPNACDLAAFSVPKSSGDWVRSRLGLLACQPLVVYTGTLGRINGLSYLVEISAVMAEIAPDVRFLIVGDGAERELVDKRARDLRVLNKNLLLWDPLPKAKIPEVLAAASVVTSFFIPIREMWNNSANKFFDALAAGRAVAINYGGWQADILRGSGAGIVLPASEPRKAARLLKGFIEDEKRISRAEAAARDLARNKFARNALSCKLTAILTELGRERAD